MILIVVTTCIDRFRGRLLRLGNNIFHIIEDITESWNNLDQIWKFSCYRCYIFKFYAYLFYNAAEIGLKYLQENIRKNYIHFGLLRISKCTQFLIRVLQIVLTNLIIFPTSALAANFFVSSVRVSSSSEQSTCDILE